MASPELVSRPHICSCGPLDLALIIHPADYSLLISVTPLRVCVHWIWHLIRPDTTGRDRQTHMRPWTNNRWQRNHARARRTGPIAMGSIDHTRVSRAGRRVVPCATPEVGQTGADATHSTPAAARRGGDARTPGSTPTEIGLCFIRS
jgi:hypothetical protein